MSLLNFLNPFAIARDYVRVPVETFVSRQYLGYKKKTEDGITSAKELLYRAGIITLFVTAILWISIFMYVIFYYTYMPNVTHVRPVHLQFKSCEEHMGICSFPSAHVQLTKRSSMLMSTQPYRIKLTLDMPESQINKDLGMFMVCAQMRAKGGVLVSSSCRSAMLRHRCLLLTTISETSIAQRQSATKYPLGSHTPRPRVVKGWSDVKNEYPFVVTILQKTILPKLPYMRLGTGTLITSRFVLTAGHCITKDNEPFIKFIRSKLHQVMRTLVLSPLLLSGVDEEKQQLQVELFSDFEDDQNLPVTDAYVELQSRYAQVYGCELHIQAHFTGLRYYMFHWPKISAVIGINTNLFFVALVFILSWYHLQDGLPEFVKSKFGGESKYDGDDKGVLGKIKLEREDSTTFYEGDILLEELQRIEDSKEKDAKEKKKT